MGDAGHVRALSRGGHGSGLHIVAADVVVPGCHDQVVGQGAPAEAADAVDCTQGREGLGLDNDRGTVCLVLQAQPQVMPGMGCGC